MNLEDICKKTIEASRETGLYIKKERLAGFEVEEKSVNSLVTRIDRGAEQMLVEKLDRIIPNAGILGEEGVANRPSEDFKWVIDPVDGTTNFIHGLPCYSVSIGLMNGNEVVAGVIYEINLDECFYAWKGGGAFLNGKPIRCTSNGSMRDSLIATGFPYDDQGKMDAYIKLFRELMENTRGLRRLGSAAVDLAYVAAGRFDAFYEYNLNAWDVAAGALIVQEAGGKVTDFSGGDDYIFGREMIACAPGLHKDFLKVVQKYF